MRRKTNNKDKVKGKEKFPNRDADEKNSKE